ncbi:hypothetical protein JMF89_01240 [Clostridiaceae bacterium UIB06]|uniref:Uncharacterized protein n=1 Tax=Clostridium thailandense TaxID=2794346 RepID=A0A949TYP1_9CLOT|nr:hypothetical protein [Clostridium thailandense]MBV7276056.1 hypothetical protein [Clostridium thailandense]MCH5135839.1 hypothetical protein [Clostridiaceae bacterium UIB06]
MFNLNDIPLTKYLTDYQKRYIDNIYNDFIINGKKVNCKYIGKEINEPACAVRLYYIEKYGNDVVDKFGSNKEYIRDKEGYMMFSGYEYKRAQYIMAKELEVDIRTISKFIVHHHDKNKINDKLWNLYLVYDKGHHRYIHTNNYKCWEGFRDLTKRYLEDEWRYYKTGNDKGYFSDEVFNYVDDKIDKYVILFNKLHDKFL